MSAAPVTVAIPVLNGEPWLDDTLAAVRSQRLDREVELLVLDSGSRDRSREIARAHGARVIELEPGTPFSHGGARNRLVADSAGRHVALLSQDARPAGEGWLASLLGGFELADDVGLVFGPYLPRPDAAAAVRRELRDWFASFSPDGDPRVDRLDAGEPLPGYPGPVTFFTDANGCLARAAWERVPYREGAGYAEDQLLARDMLAAGWAKAYVPDAGVVHSHAYGPVDQFRRFFDEWRGLREVYGHVEAFGPRQTPRRIAREAGADRHFLRAEGVHGAALAAGTLQSLGYHALRALGSAAGSRADRLPPRLRRWCSLEGRESFKVHSP